MNTAEIEQIKAKITPILKEEGVTRSSLFGSIVRGEARASSDIDVLIQPPEGMSLLGFIGLEHKLEDALRRKVDLVSFRGIHPRLKDRILKEQVPIL